MFRDHGIKCQHLDDNEFFISSNHRVYPCCYLYDSELGFDLDIDKLYKEFGKDFNNLRVHTFKEIIGHPYFNGILEKSLNKEHELHCCRCWKSCGDKGIRKNIKREE